MSARALRALLGLLLLAVAALPATATAAPLTHRYETSLGGLQSPESVAVDQSNGDVYVLDVDRHTISRFDASLQPQVFSALGGNVIDGTAERSCDGTVSEDCDQTPFNGFAFEGFGGAQVAIDNSGSPLTDGDIYVTDSRHSLVTIFAPSGAYLGALSRAGAAGASFGTPCGVAVDSSGAVYVGDLSGAVHKFVPTSGPPTNADFSADFTVSEPCELAAGAGPTAGSLFVSQRAGGVVKLDGAGVLQYQLSALGGQGVAVDPASGHVYATSGSEVAEYDAAGSAPALVDSFGSNQITGASGVAVDGTSGRVYVSDSSSSRVDVFGPLAAAAQPEVALGTYSPRSRGSVALTGYVDAGDLPTGYRFEYGTADCAGDACTSVPAGPEAALGKGAGPLRVSQTISGLEPATTYHYRLVATNAAGSVPGEDRTFSTLASPPPSQCANAAVRSEQQALALPDCRAYELVSAIPAAQRNGAEILLSTERVRAAADGGAFQFSSLGAAAGAQSVPFTTDYMGVRDPATGWAVHGLTPPQLPIALFGLLSRREPRYLGEFTPNLSSAIFLSDAPLNGEGPNVASVYNLYRRDDLLSPGVGAYRLLSDATMPQSPNAPGATGEDQRWPRLIGASADLSHVVFESSRDLTAAAASLGPGARLYESVDGSVRLVGVLPAAEGGAPSISRAALDYGSYLPHAVSADGSRVLFTTPLSAGSEAVGSLYMRDDRGTADPADDGSVKVSASEKTNGSGVDGTDPLGTQPAFFAAASADLGTVFFSSVEALTDDAPTDQPTVAKLYRYEVAAPSGGHLTLISVDRNGGDGIEDGADGTIGASADGSYVYFVASGQLVAGRPTTPGPRIFVWHQGTIRQVGAINGGEEQSRILGSEGWQPGGRWARVSADGRQLLFVSRGTDDLAGYDHGSGCSGDPAGHCKEVYLYSAAAAAGGERLQCVSCDPVGQATAADADFNSRDNSSAAIGLVAGDPYLNQALSADGRFVFFTSAERISPYDVNSDPDVYEFDSSSGRVSLLSGGRSGVASYFLDASATGDDVFFMTRDQLLPRDGDRVTDVYDARVGGGFAEPALPPSPCASISSCRPASGPAWAGLTPESLGPDATATPPRSSAKHRSAKHKHKHRPSKHRHRHSKPRHRHG